jgi:hypothetical protein
MKEQKKTKLSTKDIKPVRGGLKKMKSRIKAGLIQKFSGGDVEGE